MSTLKKVPRSHANVTARLRSLRRHKTLTTVITRTIKKKEKKIPLALILGKCDENRLRSYGTHPHSLFTIQKKLEKSRVPRHRLMQKTFYLFTPANFYFLMNAPRRFFILDAVVLTDRNLATNCFSSSGVSILPREITFY